MARPKKKYSRRLSQRLISWLWHHIQTAGSSFHTLWKTPLQTLTTILVIAIALVLPSILYLLFESVAEASSQLQQNNRISLYLQSSAKEAAITDLQHQLQQRDDTVSVTYISADEGLENFQSWSGLGNVLALLKDNPLPPVLMVYPQHQLRMKQLKHLVGELKGLPLVEQAQLDLEWVQRLHSMTLFFKRLVILLGSLLAFGVLLIVGNTIRLIIENRRDEILITKLVGGTDAFVRRPFIYTGFWLGVSAGLLAWLLVQLCLLWLSEPIQQIAGFYQADQFLLARMSPKANALLIISAALLGLMGAWLAVNQHLNRIKPK